MTCHLAALLTAAHLAAGRTAQLVPHDGAVRVVVTDLAVPGTDLTLRRALTSSLPFAGQFGAGFGMEEELRVEPLPGGAFRTTVPGPCPACGVAVVEPSPEALADAMTGAAWTLRASGASRLAAEATAYAARLAAEPAYRMAEWQRRRDGWLAAARLEPAAAIERIPAAARFRVIGLPSGYLRFADQAHVQELDAGGRLERIVSAAGLEKRLVRDAAGRITRIEVGSEGALDLEVDAAGLTTRVTTSGGAHVFYGYDGEGRMRWSRTGEELTLYRWNASGQLVGVSHSDGQEIELGYEPPDAGGRLTSLDATGDLHERYVYQGDAGGFTRSVTVLRGEHVEEDDDDDDEAQPSAATPAGPTVAGPRELRHYTYVTPLTADGRRWTWQETREEAGIVSTKVYDDRTFQVLAATEGEEVAHFAYDDQGRLLRKETAAEVTELTYGEAGKVAGVVRRRPGAGVERFDYSYDERGQLVSARGPPGAARVRHDQQGRLATIEATTDGRPSRLVIRYGEGKRISRYELVGGGTITFRYRDDGELDRAESDGGARVSRRVAANALLLDSLIRPSDVRLTAR